MQENKEAKMVEQNKNTAPKNSGTTKVSVENSNSAAGGTSSEIDTQRPIHAEVLDSEVSVKEEKTTVFFKIKNWWLKLTFKVKLYFICVLAPVFLYLFYNIFIASPMYISEAKFAVRTISPTTGGIDFASQIFNVPSTSMQEAKIVEDYLKSPDVVHVINQELDVLKHYTSSSYDWFSRLTSNPTSDDVITFWKKISLVKVNSDSSVISLSVRAYTPEMAHSIVSNALMQCEKLINSMNERARHDALLLAQNEVDVAKNKFDQAQNALKEFRNQHQDLDLKTTATGLQSLIIELEGQATSIRTQIAEALAYMQEDAPSIKALRSKLSGVEQQLEREREKVTSLSTQGQSINTLAGLYESLTIDVEFARKQLEFAMTSLEKAKIEVMSQNLYVVNIAKPSLPDESLYPKPLLYTLYLLIALNLMWAIISVIIAAIKEHLGLV